MTEGTAPDHRPLTADEVGRLIGSTPPDPPSPEQVSTELVDLLRQLYHGQLPDHVLTAAAQTATDWIEAARDGAHNPRLRQLMADDADEAAWTVASALAAYPDLRADVLAHAGVIADTNSRQIAALALLQDMDRCPHGRHQGERCLGCPGGRSPGNEVIPADRMIGHTVHGYPIRVPEDPMHLRYPQHWYKPNWQG